MPRKQYFMTQDDIAYVLAILGLLGIIFTIYKYFRDPQVATEKSDALLELRMKNLEDSVTKLLENHLPHIDARLLRLQEQVSIVNTSLVQLTTIIDERIPKK
jgi:hypothetical protein